MARDPGLEEQVAEDLAGTTCLTTKRMFGGLAWLHDGHLLCAARHDGMLIRLGAGRDTWALAETGVAQMRMGPRETPGWVWARDVAIGDDALRRRLLDAALAFVHSLPRKIAPPGTAPWDFPEHPSSAQSAPRRRRPAKV